MVKLTAFVLIALALTALNASAYSAVCVDAPGAKECSELNKTECGTTTNTGQLGCKWNGCTGTVKPCISAIFDTEEKCLAQKGCSWSHCGGTPTPCNEIKLSTDCAIAEGCAWYKDIGCSGNAADCSTYSDSSYNCGRVGCTWIGSTVYACYGTATDCQDLVEKDCQTQVGCTWEGCTNANNNWAVVRQPLVKIMELNAVQHTI